MESRRLDLKVISAKNLRDVREFGRMKVYAKISISNDPQVWKTSVDYQGGTNPTWNSTVQFYVPEAAVQHGGVTVYIKLYCECTFGDRYVGEVNLNVHKMFESAPVVLSNVIPFDVDRCDYEPSSGKVNVSYEFGEKVLVVKTASGDAADDEEDSISVGKVAFTVLRLGVAATLGVDIPGP